MRAARLSTGTARTWVCGCRRLTPTPPDRPAWLPCTTHFLVPAQPDAADIDTRALAAAFAAANDELAGVGVAAADTDTAALINRLRLPARAAALATLRNAGAGATQQAPAPQQDTPALPQAPYHCVGCKRGMSQPYYDNDAYKGKDGPVCKHCWQAGVR